MTRAGWAASACAGRGEETRRRGRRTRMIAINVRPFFDGSTVRVSKNDVVLTVLIDNELFFIS